MRISHDPARGKSHQPPLLGSGCDSNLGAVSPAVTHLPAAPFACVSWGILCAVAGCRVRQSGLHVLAFNDFRKSAEERSKYPVARTVCFLDHSFAAATAFRACWPNIVIALAGAHARGKTRFKY